MSRYTGPRNKRARQVGEDLSLKTNALKTARRLMVRPGQHGLKHRRKLSDFGTQLQEKQKLKYFYGITEKQLRRIYKEASKSTLATGSTLLSLLERRLDNTIFRLGWAPTRAAARQLVSHNHVQINGYKQNVPSYQVKVSDIIMLKSSATTIPAIKASMEEEKVLPEWLERKQGAAKVLRVPARSDILEPMTEQLVVEYYSR